MSLLMDALKKADQAQKNHSSFSNQSLPSSSPPYQENSTPLESSSPAPLATKEVPQHNSSTESTLKDPQSYSFIRQGEENYTEEYTLELEELEVGTDNFGIPISQEHQSQPLEFELIELTENLETSTPFNVDELPDSGTHNWDEELLPQFQQTKQLATDSVAARNSPTPGFENSAYNSDNSDTSKSQKPIPLFTLQKTTDDELLEDNIASKLLGDATELDHIPKSADPSPQTPPSPAKAQRLLTARQQTGSSGTGRKKLLYSVLVLTLISLGGLYYYYEFLILQDQVTPYRPGLKLPPPSSQTSPAPSAAASSDQQSQIQKLAISSSPVPEPVAAPTNPSPPITESISMEEVMPADHAKNSAVETTTSQQPAPKLTNVELTETKATSNNSSPLETTSLAGTIPQETIQAIDKKQSTQTEKSKKTAEKTVLPTSVPNKPSFPNKPSLSTESSTTAPSSPNSQLPALQEEKLQLQKKLTSIHAELTEAYHAFQQGNWGLAQQTYNQILQQDERNKDALLGLAAIAAQQGDKGRAQHYYQQVLYFYPQDFDAQAGLLANLGNASTTTESQLKLLLARSPETAHLHFSLGNLYANQGRWSQAQQAYFEAYRYENNRADYAYNLAISLDQINQPQAALDYYQKSLQLAQHQAINFNLQSVQQRIHTLQKQLANSALKAH